MHQGFRFFTVFPVGTRFFLATGGTRLALRAAEVSMRKKERGLGESGQSLIEYMILVALVVLVCVTSTKLLGTKINAKFREIKSQIDTGITVRLSPHESPNE
jgi:Flp pilus assembly pilin Flp